MIVEFNAFQVGLFGSRSMSKTIVFFNTHHRGHIAPTIALASQFVSAGHRVVYFAPSDGHTLLSCTGAELRHYEGDDHWLLRDRTLGVVEKQLDLPADDLLKKEFLLVQIIPATVALYDFCVAQLRELNPHLVVYDCACAWAKLAASELCFPAVTSCSSTLMGKDERGAVLGFLKDRPEQRACVDWLRRERGIEYEATDAYCNYDEYTIVWSLPELQPHSTAFTNAHFFGTSIPAVAAAACKNDAAASDFAWARLEAAKASGKRVVYFSMGTVVGQEGWNIDILPLLRAFVQHFAQLAGRYFVVLSIGARKEPRDVLGDEAEPSNFIIKSIVPQIDVLSRADVFVTHGGNNGFNEALFNGTPLLVIPVFGDQNMNAATVLRLGLGATIDSPFSPAPAQKLDHVTPALIADRLATICGDSAAYESVKARVAKVQASMRERHHFFENDAVSDLLRYSDTLLHSYQSGDFKRTEEPIASPLSGSGRWI